MLGHEPQRGVPPGVGLSIDQHGVAQAVWRVPPGNIRPLEGDQQAFEKGLLPNELPGKHRQKIGKPLRLGPGILGLLAGRPGLLLLFGRNAEIPLDLLLDLVQIQLSAEPLQLIQLLLQPVVHIRLLLLQRIQPGVHPPALLQIAFGLFCRDGALRAVSKNTPQQLVDILSHGFVILLGLFSISAMIITQKRGICK